MRIDKISSKIVFGTPKQKNNNINKDKQILSSTIPNPNKDSKLDIKA